MQCPACQNTDSRVLESRSADTGKSVRRRRECLNCDYRFTTYERVETVPITVIKRNGVKETFSRTKLLNGLTIACEKTNIDSRSIEGIVDEIEVQRQHQNKKDLNSSELGEMALEQLKEISEVAYIRFASVYRQFNGINDFVDTLESFKHRKKLETLV